MLAVYLRNDSMTVALPVISSLHSGQMQGSKPFLVLKVILFLFKSETIIMYSLASFTKEMPISTLEDSSWWNHLLQAHLGEVFNLL